MRILTVFIFLFAASFGAEILATESSPAKLFGRAQVDGYSVGLDESDWIWLRQKKRLVLGLSQPDYAPFEITANAQGLEGITADFAGLIGQLLHMEIDVRVFSSRGEVVRALKNGDVDLLGTANGFEVNDPDLVESNPYAEDQPVLVTRVGDTEVLSSGLEGKKVTMLYHYLSPEIVSKFYPEAHIQLHPSLLSALAAVAFGQADVYLGDSISANYLINKNYLNNVQVTDFSRLEGQGFSFAMARPNEPLLRVINAAMDAIPPAVRTSILHRWNAQEVMRPGIVRLQLTAEEQRWIDEHPSLKVAIHEQLAPLSYFDEQDQFRGITADILTKIKMRTGLKFEVLPSTSASDLMDWVATGKADILAAVVPSVPRAEQLDFSRPYLTTPFVFVSRQRARQPSTLDDMAGRTLVLTRGCVVHDFIATYYPGVNITFADNVVAAMEMVSTGKVDAAVLPFLMAKYFIAWDYRGRLRMTSTVGTEQAHVSLATTRGEPALDSILNKALLSITPEEMDQVMDRWRGDIVIEGSYWARNRSTIIQGFLIAAVLLLLAFGWILYLRYLVDKRKKVEHALSDQLEFMRALIDGTPHPIFVSDRAGRMLICNSSYLDVFGVCREDILGKTLDELAVCLSDEVYHYHQEALAVMKRGVPQVQDRPLRLSGGRVRTIYHWMLPYKTRAGEVSGMIGGWIDVSERQQLLEQLQEAKQVADDANRAKTTFLATMSHEIRTPMNAVIGMLELALRKSDHGIIDRTAIEVASGAAHDLLGLIGDILDIARIESGRLSLAPERANVRDIVRSVVRTFDGLARQKGIDLQLQVEGGIGTEVVIDPLRFKQILSNLLSNAIKFTHQGRVRVSLCLEEAQLGHCALLLRVEDSGVGISEEDQQCLFSPFAQVGSNFQAAQGGSGLGLVISRTLCEMMGGQLQLTSELGKGTQVHVNLVVPQAEPAGEVLTEVEDIASPGRKLNILVVDDYSANRMLLGQQLSYLGHCVRDAEDGVQALRDWRSGHFDVVITDCNMPHMNGYQLSSAIRQEERALGREPCRILGLTAAAQPEQRERCIEAGMDNCLFKPIGLQGLKAYLATIESLCPDAPPPCACSAGCDEIDLSELRHVAHGKPSAINGLLGELSSCLEKDLGLLLKLLARRDLPGLADLAHRVKGGARIVNAQGLIARCEALEEVCVQEDEGRLLQALDDLQQAMEHMISLLETCEIEPIQ
ncbi:transporter substrate-binding domain-containing protein [Pseudomonas plecoglossicida]|nr:transporter substrate-binding domain-containing protein [Pseudomonas plecoglossicida]